VGTGLGDTSPVKDNNPVGQGDICETVTDQNSGTTPDNLPEPAEDLKLRIGIECT